MLSYIYQCIIYEKKGLSIVINVLSLSVQFLHSHDIVNIKVMLLLHFIYVYGCHVCVYVCHVCVYVCHVYVYGCHVCVYGCHVCVYVCHVCVYVCHVYVYVCHIYVYVCHVCVYGCHVWVYLCLQDIPEIKYTDFVNELVISLS